MASNKILFIVNAPEYFVSHRLAIAEKVFSLGAEVHIASRISNMADKDATRIIEANGYAYHDLPLRRGGQNPLYEVFSILKTYILISKIKPDLVHLITVKPVLYGGIAARLAGVHSVVAAIAGLGTVFIAQTMMSKLRRWVVSRMLGFAFKARSLAVIFQNTDDRDALLALGVIEKFQSRIIRGSGVKITDYPCLPEPSGKPVVVMAARLLKDKGAVEFVDAARILHDRGFDVEMRLIGSPDSENPSSVSRQDLDRWENDGIIRLLGYRKDIAKEYAEAHIVCLPSYREGLPKCLIEAAACGRAVVTTNVPGCRDAIIPGVTGMLIPVKDSIALADAIQELVKNARLRREMGAAGRQFAERSFAIENIVDQHISIYRELLFHV